MGHIHAIVTPRSGDGGGGLCSCNNYTSTSSGDGDGRALPESRVHFHDFCYVKQPHLSLIRVSDYTLIYVDIHFPTGMPHCLSTIVCLPFAVKASQTASESKSQHRRHVFVAS